LTLSLCGRAECCRSEPPAPGGEAPCKRSPPVCGGCERLSESAFDWGVVLGGPSEGGTQGGPNGSDLESRRCASQRSMSSIAGRSASSERESRRRDLVRRTKGRWAVSCSPILLRCVGFRREEGRLSAPLSGWCVHLLGRSSPGSNDSKLEDGRVSRSRVHDFHPHLTYSEVADCECPQCRPWVRRRDCPMALGSRPLTRGVSPFDG
jgi:hypothetical protein